MYNILILGYYDKFNIGDDCFKIAFREFISDKNNIVFVNPCLEENQDYHIPEIIDCIIVGGGDIINIYFLRSIFELIQRSNYKKKVHGISIGITFSEVLEKQYLKIFDTLSVRSTNDYELAKKYHSNVTYFPDLVFYQTFKTINIQKTNKPTLGICLTRCIYKESDIEKYDDFVNSMKLFIENLLETFTVILIPFNTDLNSYTDNDIILHEDLYNSIKNKNLISLENHIDLNLLRDVNYISTVIQELDFNICMRYHSFVFSCNNSVPSLVLYTSKKLDNLINDIGYQEFSYKLQTDEHGIPMHINSNKLFQTWTNLKNNKNRAIDLINKFKLDLKKENIINYINNTMTTETSNKTLSSNFLNDSQIEELYNGTCKIVVESILDFFKYSNDDHKTNFIDELQANTINPNGICTRVVSQSRFLDILLKSDHQKLSEKVAENVSVFLTGTKECVYYEGLTEKIIDSKELNFKENIIWVINDHNQNLK